MDILDDIFFDILLVCKDIFYDRFFLLRNIYKFVYICFYSCMVLLKGNFVYMIYYYIEKF